MTHPDDIAYAQAARWSGASKDWERAPRAPTLTATARLRLRARIQGGGYHRLFGEAPGDILRRSPGPSAPGVDD